MPDYNSIEKEFLQKITDITEQHIADEQFGVSELARDIGMSRSNLLRKVKKLTGISVSQFIRQIRLQNAKEMLQEGSSTVSEVSYKVGFSSTSYFIKCFREHYGYPPGEMSKHKPEETAETQTPVKSKIRRRKRIILGGTVFLIILITSYFAVFNFFLAKKNKEISIAVLPFKNESADSTNIYFINGLMESTLSNLQKIKDLRVISRTSVEKYRNNSMTIPEIAKDLEVNYLIEGSGQKVNDQVVLNIQLIDASSDKHIWAEQYNRKVEDIFELQGEIAKNIAEKIEVIISPEVQESIEKIPTENLEAYDYFLKGIDLLNKGLPNLAKQSVPYFKKAIKLDNQFARAYSATAMAYYTIDENQATKQYTDSINYFADQAMFFDSKLPQSLIAKALFYMTGSEYKLAVPYLEKALELNPNYDLVFVYLLDLYANHLPNTEKYLEYALRGLRIDISSYDSTITSFNYLHIANAFIQAGFQEQSEKYVNISLDYNPNNLYSLYTKAYILFPKNKDLIQTRDLLLDAFKKDTTRLDIMQEIGKIYYYLRDYENAFRYYKKFVDIREAFQLNIYHSENAKIGFVFSKMGYTNEAEKLLEEYRRYAEHDHSIYKHSNLALYYSYIGETENAIKHLQLFSKEKGFFYWTVLFLPIEPIFDNVKDLPEFEKIMIRIENQFQNWHIHIKSSLQKKGLI